MALSAAVRKKRNQKVTEMLRDKCEISIVKVSKEEAIKNGNWFVPTRKSEGELKLFVKG